MPHDLGRWIADRDGRGIYVYDLYVAPFPILSIARTSLGVIQVVSTLKLIEIIEKKRIMDK